MDEGNLMLRDSLGHEQALDFMVYGEPRPALVFSLDDRVRRDGWVIRGFCYMGRTSHNDFAVAIEVDSIIAPPETRSRLICRPFQMFTLTLLLSRGLVPFLLFLLFEHGFVNIARDRFGDGIVSYCGCAPVFLGVHRESNGLSLFVVRQLVPLLLLHNFFPDVVFREAERGDGSPGILFRLSLQIFRSVRDKAKENRTADRYDERTHLASMVS